MGGYAKRKVEVDMDTRMYESIQSKVMTAIGKTLGHFQIFVLSGVFLFLVEYGGVGTISWRCPTRSWL